MCNIKGPLRKAVLCCFEALVIICQITRCPNLQRSRNMEALNSCCFTVHTLSLTITNPMFMYKIFKTLFPGSYATSCLTKKTHNSDERLYYFYCIIRNSCVHSVARVISCKAGGTNCNHCVVTT
jgi:hypothetical protein